MKSTDAKAAVIAGLSIVTCAVAYVTKGSIPDALTLIATASVGGFLGITIPSK